MHSVCYALHFYFIVTRTLHFAKIHNVVFEMEAKMEQIHQPRFPALLLKSRIELG